MMRRVARGHIAIGSIRLRFVSACIASLLQCCNATSLATITHSCFRHKRSQPRLQRNTATVPVPCLCHACAMLPRCCSYQHPTVPRVGRCSTQRRLHVPLVPCTRRPFCLPSSLLFLFCDPTCPTYRNHILVPVNDARQPCAMQCSLVQQAHYSTGTVYPFSHPASSLSTCSSEHSTRACMRIVRAPFHCVDSARLVLHVHVARPAFC